MSVSFGERVRAAIDARGRLCVGIDPHATLLAAWGLDATAAGAREFGLRVVDAAAATVGIVKPQVSFFEPYGSQGYAALEDVIRAAREAGLLVIADAKRGDIGSTMDAYAAAWLTPGSPLEADAMTANPFLGTGALEGTFTLAETHGKGVFVLAATSNPDAATSQRATAGDGRTVSAQIIREVSERNARTTPDGEWASLGFVIGATVDWREAGLTSFAPSAPILGPGFGFQGADPRDLEARFGTAAHLVVAAESRSILSAGPEGVREAIIRRAAAYGGVHV
ncbi:orotidine-5'-phosphate decarboxylase [Microbacterium awajiense]|uniref:Orotidine-5'-phosphate decarboxylase n=1 Tax=Microbacterium awajiense TaxID=415214 RepID=A0ABP7A4L3_9MICO